jgi:hypothetical protein
MERNEILRVVYRSVFLSPFAGIVEVLVSEHIQEGSDAEYRAK